MASGKIVEKFGIYFDEIGLNKTYGRMFGLFMITREPISMGRLVTELQISKSTASVEIRRLLVMGYIEKVLIPEERADFYQLKKDIWVTHFLQKMQMIKRLQSIVKEVPIEELEVFKSLQEMGDYCDFMEIELKNLADKYVRNIKKEAFGSYIEEGSEGQPFVVEWIRLPALSEAFYEKMQELKGLGIETFREIEIDFLKAYPRAVEEDKSLSLFSGLTDQKLEEAMDAKLDKIFSTHPKDLSSEWQSAMKGVYYYVVTLREQKSGKIQGFITFMGGGFVPKGEFKITVLAVDRNARKRGIASLLIKALRKIGINYKKLVASTRPSNRVAITAYEKWGFCADMEATKNSPAHFVSGHWIHLARYE
ncbi:MAG: bifunctional helix-turn-helix transcriptional regulator/GNAT family N-acetyltransferase [Verrucomicrobia bacterium]|nr:bifunctional helix-turn-helix transcriptional regulator/GNAT family N-acetyltransferase [Verrucomicrobiota bacterium]